MSILGDYFTSIIIIRVAAVRGKAFTMALIGQQELFLSYQMIKVRVVEVELRCLNFYHLSGFASFTHYIYTGTNANRLSFHLLIYSTLYDDMLCIRYLVV